MLQPLRRFLPFINSPKIITKNYQHNVRNGLSTNLPLVAHIAKTHHNLPGYERRARLPPLILVDVPCRVSQPPSYSKRLRWHRQWCLPPAALPLIGCLTLCPLRRSLCLLCSQAIYRQGDRQKHAPQHHSFEMTTTAHCSVPMPKHPSDKTGPSH